MCLDLEFWQDSAVLALLGEVAEIAERGDFEEPLLEIEPGEVVLGDMAVREKALFTFFVRAGREAERRRQLNGCQGRPCSDDCSQYGRCAAVIKSAQSEGAKYLMWLEIGTRYPYPIVKVARGFKVVRRTGPRPVEVHIVGISDPFLSGIPQAGGLGPDTRFQ